MDIFHIEHIGIAVPSLDEAIPFYENILGFKCFAIEEVPDQKVRTAFFRVGQTKLELLEGTAEDSAISKFIANNGGRGGIQHIAFAVESGVRQIQFRHGEIRGGCSFNCQNLNRSNQRKSIKILRSHKALEERWSE